MGLGVRGAAAARAGHAHIMRSPGEQGDTMAILKRGLAGEPVKILQQKLGVRANGQFGPDTEVALKKYQQENGLKVDGVAGPDTFAHLGLYELILLKVGTSGGTVKRLQQALGVSQDGQFGSGTEKAVRTSSNKMDCLSTGSPAQRPSPGWLLFKGEFTEVAASRGINLERFESLDPLRDLAAFGIRSGAFSDELGIMCRPLLGARLS